MSKVKEAKKLIAEHEKSGESIVGLVHCKSERILHFCSTATNRGAGYEFDLYPCRIDSAILISHKLNLPLTEEK